MTPWSAAVDIVDDEHIIRVSLMLSLDPGPMREFRPFLDVDLDETHALELFGALGFALDRLRAARSATQ